MLSQMALKLLSVSMSLSGRTTGNSLLINIEKLEFRNKKELFSNVSRSLNFFT